MIPTVVWAERTTQPLFITKRRGTAAQGRGLRYEKQATNKLRLMYPSLASGIWYAYRTADAPRRTQYAQFDGFWYDAAIVPHIIEIKSNHTADAFFQLARYAAIHRAAHPAEPAPIEIELCRYVDPTAQTPWKWRPINSLLEATPGVVNVWRFPVEARRPVAHTSTLFPELAHP